MAAIPVAPMTSRIHRRDPHFHEVLAKIREALKPKSGLLALPESMEDAKGQLDGLWTITLDRNRFDLPKGEPHGLLGPIQEILL